MARGGDRASDSDSGYKKAALFFAGLSLLLTLRVGLNAASFCIKRFRLDESLYSIYVSRVHNGMELFGFMGVVLATIYMSTYGKHVEYISVVVSVLFWLINIVLLFVYVTGGEMGHITRFYWTLLISGFIFGCNQVFILNLAGSSVVYYLAAVPMSGIFTSLIQVVLLHVFSNRRRFDTDLLVVAFQMMVSVIVTMITAALWTKVFIDPEMHKSKMVHIVSLADEENRLEEQERYYVVEDEANGMRTNMLSMSPILMCVLGLSVVYAFYPGVAPGMLVNFSYINKIDIILMIVSSFPCVILTIISELTPYGPNKRWNGLNAFWHLFLIVPIIQLAIGAVFVKTLHYPACAISKLMKNPNVAGTFTVIFYLCHAISIGIGFAGVEPNSNSKIVTVNLFLSLAVMNIVLFIGEGYVIELKKYDRLSWPTNSLGCFEAFSFWIGRSIVNAYGSLKAVFTTNLRFDLLFALED